MRTPHLTAWSSPSLSTMFRLRIAAGPRRLAVHRGVSSAAKESVTLEKQGQIGIVRLNDPNRLNALTADMGDRVEELVQEIKDRADEFRAIVLTGEGRAFSAGGDLDFLQKRASDTTSRNTVTMRKFYGRFLSLRSLPVPLIAALNGPAIGAGMCISLFADARVVAKDAKLGFTFVHLGLHPGMACTHYLPLLVGAERANHLLLSGKVLFDCPGSRSCFIDIKGDFGPRSVRAWPGHESREQGSTTVHASGMQHSILGSVRRTWWLRLSSWPKR
ncbi:hypothetical protein, variant 2 [Aphanomyces invadans]|uniref:Uncharacterized protein n=1 Tax=Aphanomyces invadans TaxID=157072 RepID=A0A024UR81_9STRA|nr:hypothetical protein, variant 2 [Aphanomyces invadans]ETW08814.1 hypothetical protein, variant 2 [Aphanomyces invadans]|eukprot:XP_008862619.1 hypothetical protein, variant 2 [Aphanomyces invadans]